MLPIIWTFDSLIIFVFAIIILYFAQWFVDTPNSTNFTVSNGTCEIHEIYTHNDLFMH